MGNFMNAGSSAGGGGYAHGFHLRSLNDLRSMKSADSSTTLLRYLVHYCYKSCPECFEFIDEFEPLEKAMKLELSMESQFFDWLHADVSYTIITFFISL